MKKHTLFSFIFVSPLIFFTFFGFNIRSATASCGAEVGSISIGHPAHIFISGNYAYVAGDMNLKKIDISDPLKPVEKGSLDLQPKVFNNEPQGIFVSGNTAYVWDMMYFHVIDTTSLRETERIMIGGSSSAGMPTDIVVMDGYAYFTNAQSGIFTINLTTHQSGTSSFWSTVGHGFTVANGSVYFIASVATGGKPSIFRARVINDKTFESVPLVSRVGGLDWAGNGGGERPGAYRGYA